MTMNMDFKSDLLNLSGKTAVVTGGANGIGYGIVYRFAEAGANVVIADLDLNKATQVSEELNKLDWKTKAFTCDVSNEENVKSLVEFAVKEFGSLDILVNNAGIFPNIPLSNLETEQFQKILDVNLKGVFLGVKYASQQMIKQGLGGKIINITSIDAIHPSMIGLATYDASKHGVWGFTKNVALELAKNKIYVNAIAPGGIATSGVASATEETKKQVEAFSAMIPMGRMGEPDDIGKVALFLASDMSSYMTGSQIVVDGGYLLT